MSDTTVDTDRVALSSALYSMADRFVVEAAWVDHTDVDAARKCMEIATRLADHARIVLGHGDVQKAEAYLDAGELTLTKMKETRT